ncbi:gluconate 2-dehydrogenase subunit 3 family protein [Sinomicrobium weinanense]|uniref:Gluconate 2-dehydrogenase subunit 3 family protein n=1 Tax=Sinomicrobium weinanense TaxID=2842200 RepID=A0A926JQI3_9FLAO|nr:gluconate 2-dehydrogenase subunit 3 family protein [Sinomicrobium weinanense]MBC9795447.1 gluconate 2-dehydrogenase subunit 3 family protein [Sinomicrobium weinanense]MBU3123972.1 gluconate 2-dehydrogenase subunit 3 family protein [Sinomicrobium weinanense]
MDRRETIKTLVIGGVASGLMLHGCVPGEEKKEQAAAPENTDSGEDYGRTPEEAARDAELNSKTFFTEHEMGTIAVLADMIIPADETSGSATDAEVPEFIEFIVKDIPEHQIPLRGGLMWIDRESGLRYNKQFLSCSEEERKTIVEDIAYPEEVKPELKPGAIFFSRLRNLVATGFYTSKMGIKDLGYVGNTPNEWNGVPQDVLDKHGLAYDEKTLQQCIKPEERGEIANWDNYEV